MAKRESKVLALLEIELIFFHRYLYDAVFWIFLMKIVLLTQDVLVIVEKCLHRAKSIYVIAVYLLIGRLLCFSWGLFALLGCRVQCLLEHGTQ